MAVNEVIQDAKHLTVIPTETSPATSFASGDPVVCGEIPGVALIDEISNQVVIATEGVFTLDVQGIDKDGNAAVNNGDILYYTTTDDPPLSKKNTGVRFGYAYSPSVAAGTQLVASANAGTAIKVKVGY